MLRLNTSAKNPRNCREAVDWTSERFALKILMRCDVHRNWAEKSSATPGSN